MSYIYLSDLSQGLPNLPVTAYELARMQALEATGVSHEAAKTQVYTERGSSGNPKVMAGPGDQPAPAPLAATAVPDGVPWWTIAKAGLAGVAIGGAAFALSYLVKLGRSPEGGLHARLGGGELDFDAGDAPTGMLTRNELPTGLKVMSCAACSAVMSRSHDVATRYGLKDYGGHYDGRPYCHDCLASKKRRASAAVEMSRSILGVIGGGWRSPGQLAGMQKTAGNTGRRRNEGRMQAGVVYKPGETGWVEDLGDGTFRIANVPLADKVNMDDVVTLKEKGGRTTVDKVVRRVFGKKSGVRYPAPHKKNYRTLCRAFEEKGWKLEGGVPGMALLAHDGIESPKTVASDAGVKITAETMRLRS